MGEEMLAEGRNAHCLNVATGKRFSVTAVCRLREWLKQNRIAIVHGHSYHADLYGRLAARPLGVPCFSHAHNVYARPKRHRAWINRVLARWTTAVLCVSAAVARDVRRVERIPADKIVVLPNAIDLDEFSREGPRAGVREELAMRPEERLIGTVGSLTGQKNQALLLEATARLLARGLPVRCAICGEGSLRRELEMRIDSLGLRGKAHLLGIRRPIAPILREMDLFALPSRYEGFGLVQIQAMACGVPVVVSNAPGIVAVIGPDHPGIVKRLAAEPFAAKIERFLRDGGQARALVDYQMRAIVPRLSHRRYIERLVDLYESSLRAKR